MMKLGFSTLGCPNYSVDQVISFAQDNNFDGVELRFIDNNVRLDELDAFQSNSIGETHKKFNANGIKVVCVDTSIRLFSLSPVERNQQLRDAEVYINIASGLHAPFIRVFGGDLPQNQGWEETMRAISDGLSEVSKLAEAKGVQVLIETHDSFCTATKLLELYDYGLDPQIGVLWDVLHSIRHGENFKDTYSKLGSKIKLIHFKDASEFSPSAFNFKLLGEGKIPFDDIIPFLKVKDYEGYINFEWEKAWHPEIDEPEIAIPHYATYMSARID